MDKLSRIISNIGGTLMVLGMLLTGDLGVDSIFSRELDGAYYSYAQSVEVYGRYVFIFALIWRGTYFIKTLGVRKAYIFELIFGLVLGVSYAAMAAVGYLTVEQGIEFLEEPNVKYTMEEIVDSELPDIQKTEISLLIAESIYSAHGEIFQYIDKDGELKNFIPSCDDIKKREERDKQVVEIDGYLSRIKFGIYIIFSLMVSALITALLAAGFNNQRHRKCG